MFCITLLFFSENFIQSSEKTFMIDNQMDNKLIKDRAWRWPLSVDGRPWHSVYK